MIFLTNVKYHRF